MNETAPTQLRPEEVDQEGLKAKIEELRREYDVVSGNIEEYGESGDDEPMGSPKYLDALSREIQSLESQLSPADGSEVHEDSVVS